MKSTEIDRRYRAIKQRDDNNIKAQAQANEKERPFVTEHVTERILFALPYDIPTWELPAVISALHYYRTSAFIKAAAWSSQLRNYKRELTLIMEVVSPDPIVHEIITRTLDIPVYYLRNLPLDPNDYDMYCVVDLDTIRIFRENGKFHASSAYGIVFGCEAQSMFDLPVEAITKDVEPVYTDILVIDDMWNQYAKVWQWIGETVPLLRVSMINPAPSEFKAVIGAMNTTQVVVGPCSMWTYFAACMRKPLFEFYPPWLSKHWLSKWSNPLYNMYATEPSLIDKEKVLKGVSYLWYCLNAKNNRLQSELLAKGT